MQKKLHPTALLALLLAGIIQAGSLSVNAAGTVHFKVKVDASLASADKPFSGRLLIFMTSNTKPLNGIEPDFTDPEAVYITGMEVANLDGAKTIDVDADAFAFPRAFSSAPAGKTEESPISLFDF